MSDSSVAASEDTTPLTLSVSSVRDAGVRSHIQIRDFGIVADEPTQLGGSDAGPNPMEYVLAGLTSCMTVMIELISQEQALPVGDIRFDLQGDLDLRGLFGTAPVRPDFTAIRGTVSLGTEATPEQVGALRDEVYRRCPAYNLFRNAGIPLDLAWETKV